MTPSIRSIQATPAPRQSQAYTDAVGVPPAELAPEAVRFTAEQAELLLGDGIILQDPYCQPLAVFRAADLEAMKKTSPKPKTSCTCWNARSSIKKGARTLRSRQRWFG